MNKLIQRNQLEDFFKTLNQEYEIIGPIKRDDGVTCFDVIDNFNDLYIKTQTNFSPKKFFLPAKEILFEFNNSKSKDVSLDIKKRIIILRACDANAIDRLERVYNDKYPDKNYVTRRKNTLIFVIKCLTPHENCACTDFGTYDAMNYDLMFVPMGDKYIVNPKTSIGEELTNAKHFAPIIREGYIKINCNKNNIDLKKLDYYYDDPIWEEYADKCINCNACINVCPTCMCFNVADEVNIDIKSGQRVRVWDSCYLRDFTKVAGEHIFREDKVARFKHRIYHKLKYYKEKHGVHMCVGCGRCSSICPADIDMFEIISRLGKK
jgi:sulfhydrogenase subunit beta (sulfur reductase)